MGALGASKWYVGLPLSHGMLATIASFVSWSSASVAKAAAKKSAADGFFFDVRVILKVVPRL